MDDTVYRKDVIETMEKIMADHPIDGYEDECQLINAMKSLPSAQPERLTDDDFETIRIHLSAYKERLCNQHRWEEAEKYQRIIDRFMTFASEQESFEWCHDCKEYDQAQHCCHRWTKTIRKTVDELKQSAQQGIWQQCYITTPTGGQHCVWECDGCGARVAERTKYCAECGRRMTE